MLQKALFVQFLFIKHLSGLNKLKGQSSEILIPFFDIYG
jgi:hypothetical protein